MRLLAVGDLHLSDTGPAARTDNYITTCFDKLQQVKDIIERRKPDIVVFTGDFFHSKSPKLISHYLVNSFNSYLSSINLPVYAPIGNHDLPTKGFDFLSFPCAALKVNFESDLEHLKLLNYYTTESEIIRTIKNLTAEIGILVVHAGFHHNPDAFRFEMFDFDTAAQAAKENQNLTKLYVIFGHIHWKTNPTTIGKVTFLNPGALLRVSISQTDIEHIPSIFTIDTTTGEISTDNISVVPMHKISNLVKRKLTAHQDKAHNSFVQSLSPIRLTTEIDIEHLIKEADAAEPTKKKAISLVREVQHDVYRPG